VVSHYAVGKAVVKGTGRPAGATFCAATNATANYATTEPGSAVSARSRWEPGFPTPMQPRPGRGQARMYVPATPTSGVPSPMPAGRSPPVIAVLTRTRPPRAKHRSFGLFLF